MNPKKLFPLLVADNIDALRSFYVDTLGFTVVMEQPGYLQVKYGEDAELSFMSPAQPGVFKAEALSSKFDGKGLMVSIPTASSDELYKKLKDSAKGNMLGSPTDRPWGWRSFFMSDPNGVVLDFFHVIKPAS